MTHLDIVEVGELCTRQIAASRELFEVLGGWVDATDDPARQRLFATACHRHAWHAELWRERRPAIPEMRDVEWASPAWPGLAATRPNDRRTSYRSVLDTMIGELDQLVDRIDDGLDPSTARTVALVRADLVELRSRLG